MTEIRTFKRIGATVREEACDLVEAKLPEPLRKLLERLVRAGQSSIR